MKGMILTIPVALLPGPTRSPLTVIAGVVSGVIRLPGRTAVSLPVFLVDARLRREGGVYVRSGYVFSLS